MVSSFTLLFFLCIPCYYAQTGTDGESDVRFWNFKIKAQTTIEYTISANSSLSLSSKDIATCGRVVIRNQTDLTLDTDYTIYVDVSFIDLSTTNETNQVIVNFTVWTENKSFFKHLLQFMAGDEFEDGLIKEMENSYDDLDIIDINTEIVHTHGDKEAPTWQQWLDVAHYTPFQWVCVGGALLLICIAMFCFVYCCVCRTTDDTDPYKNVQFERNHVGQVSPISPYANSSESPQSSPHHGADINQDINWVEC